MPALIERPKMSLEMWAAMKSHIMKQREKKKQELEADAAIERIRREQEHKRKQDAMTLEEIKDQLGQLEHKLTELKEEKHQLFLQLKKVLHEDENRKRAQVKEANEMVAVSHGYAPQVMNLGAPPPLYMHAPGPHLLNRAPALYKVGMPPQQTLMPPGALKRPRSSSPTPQHGAFHQNFNFKTHIATFPPKQNIYPGGQSSAFYVHPNSAQQISGGQVVNPSSVSVTVTASTPSSSYQNFQFAPPESNTKHHPAYHVPHLSQQGFVNSLQQQLEQANQKQNFPEEKYYVQQVKSGMSIRGVTPLTGTQSIIPIQQQTTKVTGGITSGYPVRTQPPSSGTHYQQTTSAGTQPSHPHNAFQSQPGVTRLSFPTQNNPRYY